MKREFHLNFTKTAGPRLRCFVEARSKPAISMDIDIRAEARTLHNG
jgi:hypothetical protein